jgi:hypothetical protein
MESEGSLLCLQQAATVPCPEAQNALKCEVPCNVSENIFYS